jgi:hypothetical protein
MGAGDRGRRRGGMSSPDEIRSATIVELEDWERHGAVWRPVDVSDAIAVVDLCSCTGEPMDRVQSRDRGFIEFVRTHGAR